MTAVAGGHPGDRNREGHLKEDRQIPDIGELVAMKEQSVNDEDRARRGLAPRWVKQLIGQDIVDGGLVPAGASGTERIQHLGSQARVVV